jgi:predicted metal-dependent phosphoesterase TrpH
VQGAEIEVDTHGITQGKRTELLIYGSDLDDEHLINNLVRMREARKTRMYKMIGKLTGIGFEVNMDDVRKQLKKGETTIGRPHLAKALIEKRYVKNMDEAFDKYLKRGCPTYVPREIYPMNDLITRSREIRTVTILAHPLEITTDLNRLEKMIRQLAERGIDGVEVYYNYVRYRRDKSDKLLKESRVRLHELCQELDLLETGGSDFHGFEDFDVFEPVNVPEDIVWSFLDRLDIQKR